MEIILGKTAGFCYGVKRAVEQTEKILEQSKEQIYCLGEIVHNKEVIKMLENKGIKFIDKIDESKGRTIIRAHGIPKSIYEKAKEKEIQIEDFTCPNVLKIHQIANQYSKQGYYIFLIGAKKHPENVGTISYCGKNLYVIEDIEDIYKALEKLRSSHIKNLLVISQTTYKLDKFCVIEKVIKNKLSKQINLVIKNTICKATEIRQKETKIISEQVDFMIIIGGRNSSNTKKIYEVAKSNCKNVISIETKSEIDIENLKLYERVGIMAGASTPQNIIEEVIKYVEKECIKEKIEV